MSACEHHIFKILVPIPMIRGVLLGVQTRIEEDLMLLSRDIKKRKYESSGFFWKNLCFRVFPHFVSDRPYTILLTDPIPSSSSMYVAV